MSPKTKRNIIYILIFLPVVAILLWPLGTERLAIRMDKKAMENKKEYLNKQITPAEPNAPNILLITVDDLGMADCSLYDEGDIETPNIDRLGSQGVVFENAYVTSPVCAPSRAALITGRYQHRFGFEFTMHDRYLTNQLEYLGFRYFVKSKPWKAIWTNESPDERAIENQGLPRSEITLAEVLKKHGYTTGIIGKWHLGWTKSKLPSDFGFEEQYGFFHSHSLYIPEGTPGYVDQKIEADWTDPHIWGGQRDGTHAIFRNNERIEESGYLTDRITDESITYMENHKNKPFFLWLSYNAPHTPLQAPEEYVNRFMHIEDPVKRVYRAMIANLDDNIGRLTDFLHQEGLDTNTLVFLISDNGGAEYTLTTDNGRYEGGKNTEFEGGVKVPMIVSWKGTIPEGKRFGPMVSAMDIFATSVAAAGASFPDRDIDGVNLLPYLSENRPSPPHEYLYWQKGISKAVRSNEWKLVLNEKTDDTLLYHLAENRYEAENEAKAHPSIVNRLLQSMKEWRKTHAQPMWPPVVYYMAEKDGKMFYFEQ